MSRAGEGGRLKKHNCCLTCSIICFILTIVFFAALYIGGSIMFKTYVSPHIGGLELNDVIGLAANVLSGKEAETTYAEEDLDNFYSGLSEAMFLSEKSEDELEYELVPEATRAALAPSGVAAAGEDAAPAYDEDAAYAAFLLLTKQQRYALLTEEMRGKISLEEYSALAGSSDAAGAARDKVGLKPYRISLDTLLGNMDFGAENFSPETALEKSLSSLDFNFGTLENYDIDDPTAQANEKFTTFSVNGKQVSAFIDDVLSFFLSSPNSPLTSAMKDTLPVALDLTDYFKVSSVTIMNTPLATKDGEALYDQKDTALGVSISLKLRDLVKAALETDELKQQLSGVPSFALNLIPNLVPKHFSLHAKVYPLAPAEDKREVVLMVNKPSEKNAQRLSTLLNALLGKEGENASETFLGGINNQISSAFTSINETVKINFVPSKDKEGNPLKDEAGNTYSEMKIMTWDTVLSLFDKDGRLSSHDVFTMLKCLYISTDRPDEIELEESFTDFKSDMSAKYGVSSDYLKDHNLLSTDDLGGMLENIDLKTVDFTKSNDEMQVSMPAEALAALMKKMLTEEDKGVAADGEETETSDPSSMLKGLDPKVCGIEIKKVSEQDDVTVYSFEMVFAADLAEMVKGQLPSDGIAGNVSRKLLPKQSSYFGIKIYLSEYTDGDKVLHKVGKNIDSPAEGVASAYASKIRINDFNYEETGRVMDSFSLFMKVVSGSEDGFDLSSVTNTIEDSITDVFNALADNEFNLTLRLYESNGTDNGGVNLPSLYELVESLVKPQLDAEKGETFTTDDARDVLYLMYTKEVSMDKNFADGQEQVFLDEINDKFYIVKDSALETGDLFGDGAGNLAEKIKADSIYFKPTETEAAKWTGEKKALYTDTRTSAELRASLTGSEIAALVKDSNMIPTDMIASFGDFEVLGSTFETADGKTYLTFDMKLLFNKGSKDGESVSAGGEDASKSEGEDAVKYSNIFPDDIKLSAKILLYAAEYTEAEPRYHAEIEINEDDSSKIFLLMKVLGGEDLSKETIASKIAESIATTFNTLEGKVPLYYQNAGAAYTSGTEECIKVADVFTFLVKETSMKDSAEENAPLTDPDALAARLRGFGQQTKFDAANEGVYTWMGDLLKLFADTDDDYIYQNMQRAYFLNDEPTMEDIYNDNPEKGFASKFNTIKSDTFNLNNDENGLFYYDGNILNLKVSDRALAVIVKKKQSFAAAVTGEGMTVELMSLKLYHEDAKLVIESGVKISFDGRDSYKMMPDYFFVIAKTKSDGMGGYTTTVSMNNLTTDVTNTLFRNINSLSTKGMTSSFDKTNIETTINNAIATALGKFPNSVTFGEFTSSDVTNEYNVATYGDTIRVAAGDGYISFPSVYSYLIDMFYTSEEAKPLESEMQSMLVHLHAGDSAVESAVVTNPMNDGAYHAAGFTGSNPMTDATMIFSDRYLASEISTRFSAVTLQEGKISLGDSIKQTILLRGLGESETLGERATWESKFFSGGSTYVRTDNYMIATACVSLDYYNSGDKTTLLPENLWFTVLADLDTTANSEGLLYDMSIKDMEIFQHVLSKSNNFNIKAIAMEFAGKIKEQINAFVTSILPGANVAAHLAADEFVYFESYLHTENEYKLYANTEMIKLMSDDKPNGIGYLVLSAS